MPWHIEDDNAGCAGFAVVKDDDGEVEGCHRTREQAERQLAALYASEADDDEDDDEGVDDDENLANEVGMRAAEPFTPNDAMMREAQRGLDWRAEYNRGGTEVGVARARDIVNRRGLSRDTVARMVSYFARHEVDKQGQGWSPDEDGYPSAGRIAWALWGGDAGKSWAETIIREERAGQGELAVITDIDGTLRLDDGPNRELISYLNESDAEVIVITGRNESQRRATIAYLDSIGLDWELLEMSPGGNPATFKRRTAERLLARYEIREAFENDPSARDAYNSLGINAKTPQARTATAKAILAHVRRNRLH